LLSLQGCGVLTSIGYRRRPVSQSAQFVCICVISCKQADSLVFHRTCDSLSMI
jgi:hypothetical protein